MKQIKVMDDQIILIENCKEDSIQTYTVPDDFNLDFTIPFSAQVSIVNLTAKKQLQETDSSIIRIIEDIFDLLVEKNIIQEEDLNEIARQKIVYRKNLRATLSTNENNNPNE